MDGLEEKALKTGASKLYIEDLNKEFVEDFVSPTVQAGAVYEGCDTGVRWPDPPDPNLHATDATDSCLLNNWFPG